MGGESAITADNGLSQQTYAEEEKQLLAIASPIRVFVVACFVSVVGFMLVKGGRRFFKSQHE